MGGAEPPEAGRPGAGASPAPEADSTSSPERGGRGPEEEEALRLWIALARCYSTFARAVSGKVLDYGLTSPQLGVLEALHHVGPLSLGELAEKLLVTGGNITYVMDRLEAQGLVYRERSRQDRRVVEARLTEEGRRVVEEYFPLHAHHVRELTEVLEPGERRELRRLLKKLGKGVAPQAKDEPTGEP